ncbi:caspase family protein [Mucilaginibacter flavidus]|uniref:caspase family protein n=1 Tax=Mucilaginibacter flavidus TaxID=2949309 RepID=UPI002093B0F0|nr:caspase family protein [Mucilaginibacter flavidus]MCO5950833.1 caspase family protein [Mucilaginibacter flavidus]
MRRIFTAIYLFALLLCGTASAQSLIYYNAFSNGESSWRDYDDQVSNARIAGGKYLLTHKQHSSTVVAQLVPVDYNRNFAIQTTFSHVTGGTNFPAGLAFFGQDALNTYFFCITATGSFQVGKFDRGQTSALINWTTSPAILQGNASNKLRIEKLLDRNKFYINGVQVAELPPLQPFGNHFGPVVMEQQTAAFDYIKLVYLASGDNEAAANTPAISAGILETAYHTDFNADDNNQWVLPTTDSLTTALTDGYFKMVRRAKTGYNASVTSADLKVDMRRDYLMETEAVHYSGTQNFGYGLVFGCDEQHNYMFWMGAGGYYYIGSIDKAGFKTIVTWTASDAIRKGDLSKNKLGIAHRNGQLNFYINDQLVTSHPEIEFTGHQFGVSVSANQNVGFNYITFGYLDKPKPAATVTAQNDITPPEIFITSPEVTRGLKVVQSSDVLHVAGIAKDPSGIFSVVVNGIQAVVDKTGSFTVDVPMAIGENPLLVVATDNNMNKGQQRFSVTRNNVAASTVAAITQTAAQGKFYALLIGVQDYQDQSIPSLEGPVGDAATLSQALTGNYTFNNESVTLLKNPTRAQFFAALDDVSAKVKPEDNLLIFYAGHGYYDETHLQGYWYPADAVRTRRDTWISNADLIDYITAIKSKHTLLISDACFSGSIFKTRAIEMAPKDVQELYKLPSRKAMTSGAMKEVPDKSVFMQYLVKRLTENTDKFLPSEQLFASFKAAVINNSPNGQVPQFGEIREAGDEGGDFIFIRK